MKTCSKCGETKALGQFTKGGGKDGLHSRCRSCNAAATAAWGKANPDRKREHARRTLLKMRYGISVEKYDEMLADQGGVCAVCRRPPWRIRLGVDHDETTGRIRGLLCDPCNRAIGHLAHDPQVLQRAIDYLVADVDHGVVPDSGLARRARQ